MQIAVVDFPVLVVRALFRLYIDGKFHALNEFAGLFVHYLNFQVLFGRSGFQRNRDSARQPVSLGFLYAQINEAVGKIQIAYVRRLFRPYGDFARPCFRARFGKAHGSDAAKRHNGNAQNSSGNFLRARQRVYAQ